MNLSIRSKLLLALLWLALTSSLIIWWMVFTLRLLRQTNQSLGNYYFMLLGEGVFLLTLLVLGGVTLSFLLFKYDLQKVRLAQFLQAFSHDIKTALASLRLQTESLQEDISDPTAQAVLQRLSTDVSRILVRVENTLLLDSPGLANLVFEKIKIQELLSELRTAWPQIEVVYSGPDVICTDRRALNIILQNLVHNSYAHGKARKVNINIHSDGTFLKMDFADRGLGFRGDAQNLGKGFHRHYQGSGTGMGLRIVTDVVQALGGPPPQFDVSEGFIVRLQLPEVTTSR